MKRIVVDPRDLRALSARIRRTGLQLQGIAERSGTALPWMPRSVEAEVRNRISSVRTLTNRLNVTLAAFARELDGRAAVAESGFFGPFWAGALPVPTPRPTPRIYIINGITSDTGGPETIGEWSHEMELFWEAHGYPADQIAATVQAYDDPHTPKYVDVRRVQMEFGRSTWANPQPLIGSETHDQLEWIRSDLSTNPLARNQEIILVGHSGGGALAAAVGRLMADGRQPVRGVVTLGSPYVNWRDLPESIARLALREDEDWAGNPRQGLGWHAPGNWDGEPPARWNLRVDIDDFPNTSQDAHNSYKTSKEVMAIIGERHPEVAAALRAGQTVSEGASGGGGGGAW